MSPAVESIVLPPTAVFDDGMAATAADAAMNANILSFHSLSAEPREDAMCNNIQPDQNSGGRSSNHGSCGCHGLPKANAGVGVTVAVVDSGVGAPKGYTKG